ncbi:MAG: S8 family serine peptidase [Candidatus Zophobacter franzmannii]|nr:S8 family serine peptidase [Candidatus Zophobacter franzmannii]
MPNPIIDGNGIVKFGITELDSLNNVYNCTNFSIMNFSWATYLRNYVFLYFDNSPDVELLCAKYNEVYGNNAEFIQYRKEPELVTVPGDYMYSSTKQHPEDVLWKFHADTGVKSTWRIYAGFNLSNIAYGKLQNNFNGSFEFVNNHTNGWPPLLDQYNYRGYLNAYHGNLGLWHHTKDYNDTYRAWQYSKGGNQTATISDSGAFPNHPDLISQWVSDSSYLNNFRSNFNTQYQPGYHATQVAGALAASASETPQTVMNEISSHGIAPDVQMWSIGSGDHSLYSSLATYIDYLVTSGVPKPAVVTCSWVGFDFTEMISEYEDQGITLVIARPYGRYNFGIHHYDTWANNTSAIVVGDYDPDYRIKTRFGGEDTNGDYIVTDDSLYIYAIPSNYASEQFTVNINAPGWNVWTTSIYPGVTPAYTMSDGWNTSIAAPQVAGVVCMVKDRYPWMTPAQVKTQILGGAHHLSELISASASFLPDTPTSFFGEGCLSAYRSLFLSGNHSRDFIFTTGNESDLLLGKDCNITNSTITIPDGQLRVLEGETASFASCTITIGDDAEIFLEKGASLEFGPGCIVSIGE